MLREVMLGLGVVIWVTYLALILPLARELLGSRKPPLRMLYWATPILLVLLLIFLALAAVPFGTSVTHAGVGALFLAPIVALLLCYLVQALAWGYIFRCSRCGTIANTYRVWWRTGIYRCPHCASSYYKGRLGDVAV